MKAYEKKLGRIFQLQFEKGDDFHPILNAFVKEKKIMDNKFLPLILWFKTKIKLPIFRF